MGESKDIIDLPLAPPVTNATLPLLMPRRFSSVMGPYWAWFRGIAETGNFDGSMVDVRLFTVNKFPS
jgi:hypothetical protein